MYIDFRCTRPRACTPKRRGMSDISSIAGAFLLPFRLGQLSMAGLFISPFRRDC